MGECYQDSLLTNRQEGYRMKKLLASLTLAALLPTASLASSIRPGSPTHKTLNQRSRQPNCLVEEKWIPCEVTIDETGVKGPGYHITDIVQWKTEEKDFNYGGALVGGAAGASAGFAAGLGSCMVLGPFCLITAPTLMGAGMGGGAELGGKGTGRFFTIVGDNKDGKRIIREIHYKTGKAVKKASKKLLVMTQLAEGELKS